MRKKSSKISTIILLIVLLVGLSVMLYPIISDWWNSRVQTRAIETYDENVREMDEEDFEEIFREAEEYNRLLCGLAAPFSDYDQIPGYDSILDITDTGIMGYVTIPAIGVNLPIYHGTSVEVLNVAVGHFQGSSLPVGGTDTHAVISAHRGLPSAKLFSDLDELVEGDTFTVTILNEVLTYQVDKISIVLPNELDELAIIPGGDYVTLMTCTPYGVNSHRLLVRGKRIDTVYASTVNVVSDAVLIDPMTVFPIVAAPMVAVLLLYWIFGGKSKRKPKKYSIYELPDFNNSDFDISDISHKKRGDGT